MKSIKENCVNLKVCSTFVKDKATNRDSIEYTYTPVSKNAKLSKEEKDQCKIVPVCEKANGNEIIWINNLS